MPLLIRLCSNSAAGVSRSSTIGYSMEGRKPQHRGIECVGIFVLEEHHNHAGFANCAARDLMARDGWQYSFKPMPTPCNELRLIASEPHGFVIALGTFG